MVYDKNNIFAKIIRGDVPTNKVYEDDSVIVIKDLHPQAPTHLLFLPKGEFISFDDFNANAKPEIITHFFSVIQQVARKYDLHKTGYRLIMNTGEDANQQVKHFHCHLIAGKKLTDF